MHIPDLQQSNAHYNMCICFQVHLLVQLALADLLAALILMYTSAMNKVSPDNIVAICQYSLPLSLVKLSRYLNLNFDTVLV